LGTNGEISVHRDTVVNGRSEGRWSEEWKEGDGATVGKMLRGEN
jgi:hypothetical protein